MVVRLSPADTGRTIVSARAHFSLFYTEIWYARRTSTRSVDHA